MMSPYSLLTVSSLVGITASQGYQPLYIFINEQTTLHLQPICCSSVKFQLSNSTLDIL